MQQALVLAKNAADLGELPVGAVVVKNGVVIGEGWNLRETNRDALHHAEIMAIQEAAKNSNAWRLSDTTLYVTLEPCLILVPVRFIRPASHDSYLVRSTQRLELVEVFIRSMKTLALTIVIWYNLGA